MQPDYSPLGMLRSAFTELQEEMCQAVDRYCGQHTRDIESRAVSIIMSTEEEMRMKLVSLEEGDKWFAEYGCTICDLGPRGHKLTDCIKGTTGSGVRIENDECYDKERGSRIGTFHTHPYGGAAPSVGDIMNVFIDKRHRAVNFIGGVVGGHKVIVGYALRPESIMKWEMKQRFTPYRSACRAVTEYVVQFVFRMPEATSADDLTIQRYDVFSEDKQMSNFMDDIDYLKTIFAVIVHWC